MESHMPSEALAALQKAKAQIIVKFVHQLEVDPATIPGIKDYDDQLTEWHSIIDDLIHELQDIGLAFNKAFYQGTPLMHILLASPYLSVEDKRIVVRRLRSFIAGTDTDILDIHANTTLHYFFKQLIDNPSVLLLEAAVDRGFIHSMFTVGPDINNQNPDGKTVLDLLNEILADGIMYNIQDGRVKEELRDKFHELLPELHAIQEELLSLGAKTSEQLG